MGWFSDDKPKPEPKPDDEKPWNKFPDAETAKKLAKGGKKTDPQEKDPKNPPKKSGWW
jgi:hypothetical protein